jgi:hypothetical protein
MEIDNNNNNRLNISKIVRKFTLEFKHSVQKLDENSPNNFFSNRIDSLLIDLTDSFMNLL